MVRVLLLGVLVVCVIGGFVVGVASLLRNRLDDKAATNREEAESAAVLASATEKGRGPGANKPAGPSADQPAGPILLAAADAKLHGSELRLEGDGTSGAQPDRAIGAWRNPDEFVEWSVEPREPGAYDVQITYACDGGDAGGDFLLMVGPQMLRGRSVSTGGWTSYQTVALGTATLPPQRTSLVLRAAPGFTRGRTLMNVRSLRLVPQGYVEPPTTAPVAPSDVVIELPASAAALQGGGGLALQPGNAGIGSWSQEYQFADWPLKLPAAGRFDVEIDYACGPDAGGDFIADFGEDKLFARSEPTGSWQEYKTLSLGTVYLTPAVTRLTIRPVGAPRESLMNLRAVRLVPAK